MLGLFAKVAYIAFWVNLANSLHTDLFSHSVILGFCFVFEKNGVKKSRQRKKKSQNDIHHVKTSPHVKN